MTTITAVKFQTMIYSITKYKPELSLPNHCTTVFCNTNAMLTTVKLIYVDIVLKQIVM
jgi:hypothetical protein